jgi:ATP-dependent Lhr-like helicase
MGVIIDRFSTATRDWMAASFAAPTPAQREAWSHIALGRDVLVIAPTGSGKTLAAFLWALDRLLHQPPPDDRARLRVLYISPLKSLAADVERNLRAPLAGIRAQAERAASKPATGSQELQPVTIGVRSGDTPENERRRFSKTPPDILITTPESLFLLLTSAARDALRFVDTVIIDEIHAMAGTKRGAHLALSLERLDALRFGGAHAQRVGLSATVRPADEVARFLGGARPVDIVEPHSNKQLELRIEVPIEDMAEIGQLVDEVPTGRSAASAPDRKSIWPAVEARLVELIAQHRTTLVFANSRRLAERLCLRLNELAERDVARAHHASVSREQRRAIEDDLKSGRLPCVVATSSLELGVDMGAVDLVVQIESPPSVASGLQRIGRAGHQVGAVSRGIVFPKWRGDLIECAVVAERMQARHIEALKIPRNPLDVLAQHIVSMVAMDDWPLDELAALVRRAAPFQALPASALESVLDMLSGRYPSDEFAELRPRLQWDRVSNILTPRGGAQRLAVTSGGTIPDRGLFGVFLIGDGERQTRVGELDEEMVYECKRGDVFALGSSSWRIEDITHDRVLVTPAPGEPSKVPFWHGDTPPRPVELGRAVGAFLREVSAAGEGALARLEHSGLDPSAARNVVRYVAEQVEATGGLPDDRTIVAERFLDELGDWRICIHCTLGAAVNGPWALAIAGRVRERTGLDIQTMHSDDGIVFRLPEADVTPPAEAVLFDPDEIETAVTEALSSSALFASRFRECAARALLLPRRDPGKRTPLWAQRQRSASLLQVAAGHGSFPIVLETMRECLQDVFDVPALRQLMADLRSRAVKLVQVETRRASPFASALLFGWVGAFIYDGDAPLAERRAQALSLDMSLLSELLGQAELRELIDPAALAETELEVARLTPARHARNLDEAHDLLRLLGDLTSLELSSRGVELNWIQALQESRRALAVHVAGEARWIAVEDAARYRDALGTLLPPGVPAAFLEPVRQPLHDLVGRYARTHGPFVASDVASRLGLGVAVVTRTLEELERAGRVLRGAFRPAGAGVEWVDAEVLRLLRRRSLAKLRHEVEPVSAAALGRFLPAWQDVKPTLEVGPPTARAARVGDVDVLLRAIEQLQGVPLPASALETIILPSRVPRYAPSMLDELCATGEVLWAGHGALGNDDGWVALYVAEDAPLLLPPTPPEFAGVTAFSLQLPESCDKKAVTPAARSEAGSVTPAARSEAGSVTPAARSEAGSVTPAARSEAGSVTPAGEGDGKGDSAVAADSGVTTADVLAVLRRGGALFFRQLSDAVRSMNDATLLEILWDLVWSGHVTNDTLVPLRAWLARAAPSTRERARRARRRGPALPSRQGPPAAAGRWWALPARDTDETRRRKLLAEQMLERHGVLTRGAVTAEEPAGGFAGIYPVLRAFEESGRCRRGYFVEALGAAQFALAGAIDRLRATADTASDVRLVYVLAACDPANPYGAALPWPQSDETDGARPGRKAGALVVLVDGVLTLYVERGGRSWRTFESDAAATQLALQALARAVAEGRGERLTVEKVDGVSIFEHALHGHMAAAGFKETHRGWTIRP